jgi:hypothetical protein
MKHNLTSYPSEINYKTLILGQAPIDQFIHGIGTGMMRVINSAIFIAFAMLTMCCGSQAQNKGSESDSCRKFVQEFYDWYLKHSGTNLDRTVIDERADLFAPKLLALLKKDVEYKAPELDLAFDESYFTLTQENADSYMVGTPTQIGSIYRVPVYGVREGTKSSEPEVWAEVQREKGNWQFINFIDLIEGTPQNLVSDLRRLQVERARAQKR